MEQKLGAMRTSLRVAAGHGRDALREAFGALVPDGIDSGALVAAVYEAFSADTAPDLLAELAATITATCDDAAFHTWNYDHLEFIIEQSNRHHFRLPRNIVNGLPEQLILLVDSDNLIDPDCE